MRVLFGLLLVGVILGGCGGSEESPIRTRQEAEDTAENPDEPDSQPGDGDGDGDTEGASNDLGPVPEFDSTLDDDADLADLSADERQQLCDDVNEFVEEEFSVDALEPLMCNLIGLVAALEATGIAGGETPEEPPLDSELQEICNGAEAACLAGAGSALQDQFVSELGSVECGSVDPSCTATVADFEQCLNDLGDLREDLDRAAPPCDSVTFATVALALISIGEPAVPMSCDAVQNCAQ